jgi:uncharacterized membrane protein
MMYNEIVAVDCTINTKRTIYENCSILCTVYGVFAVWTIYILTMSKKRTNATFLQCIGA